MTHHNLHQTLLFVPGDRPDRFMKAARTEADAIIIDLEDAVAESDKIAARSSVRADFSDVPVIVRINAVGTEWYDGDIAKVCDINPAAVMLPKVSDPEMLVRLVASLDGRIPVIALIECARGLANARAIAAVNGVTRLAFGSIDFCVDLGCAHSREAMVLARSELVLASRVAGIAAPIDGVTTDLKDPSVVYDDAKYAQSLGFGGKLCIHPVQVLEVKRGFAPNADDINWAHKILASGDAAADVDGAMVDKPVRLRAQAILAAADAR